MFLRQAWRPALWRSGGLEQPEAWTPDSSHQRLQHTCLIPGYCPSPAIHQAVGHTREDGREARLGSSLTLRRRRWQALNRPQESSVRTAGPSRCPVRDAKARRTHRRPAGGARAPRHPALRASAGAPARPGAGAAGQQTPGIDYPRAHFRVPPPAAAIGQWAARRGCSELLWTRPPPAPGQPPPSGFASSVARRGCGFAFFIYILCLLPSVFGFMS